jgi:hypothetical protein
MSSKQKKADVVEHPQVFHHVGILVNGPPDFGRVALYLVIRLRIQLLYEAEKSTSRRLRRNCHHTALSRENKSIHGPLWAKRRLHQNGSRFMSHRIIRTIKTKPSTPLGP